MNVIQWKIKALKQLLKVDPRYTDKIKKQSITL